MSKQHTPTPWRRRKYSDSTNVIIKGDKDIAYTADYSETGKADAELIVKAVNNHDRLVETLKGAFVALGKCTIVDEGTIDAHLKAKHLLTELKQ